MLNGNKESLDSTGDHFPRAKLSKMPPMVSGSENAAHTDVPVGMVRLCLDVFSFRGCSTQSLPRTHVLVTMMDLLHAEAKSCLPRIALPIELPRLFRVSNITPYIYSTSTSFRQCLLPPMQRCIQAHRHRFRTERMGSADSIDSHAAYSRGITCHKSVYQNLRVALSSAAFLPHKLQKHGPISSRFIRSPSLSHA